MDIHTRLSAKERDELETLMDVRDPDLAGPMQGSLTRVHGFLTCILSGPMVMPSEWIPLVFVDQDDRAWKTMAQAQRAMSLLMRFYNEIASDLADGGRGYGILLDRIGDDPDTVDLADDWCRGYRLGVAMRADEWKKAMEAPKLLEAFEPIRALGSGETTDFNPLDDPERYRNVLDALPNCALEVYEWWRANRVASMPTTGRESHATVRRTAPKISPNANCPCGSGKKYKRCCSALRAL